MKNILLIGATTFAIYWWYLIIKAGITGKLGKRDLQKLPLPLILIYTLLPIIYMFNDIRKIYNPRNDITFVIQQIFWVRTAIAVVLWLVITFVYYCYKSKKEKRLAVEYKEQQKILEKEKEELYLKQLKMFNDKYGKIWQSVADKRGYIDFNRINDVSNGNSQYKIERNKYMNVLKGIYVKYKEIGEEKFSQLADTEKEQLIQKWAENIIPKPKTVEEIEYMEQYYNSDEYYEEERKRAEEEELIRREQEEEYAEQQEQEKLDYWYEQQIYW